MPSSRRQSVGGPKPAISDQALLVAIEADLEASPWEGEGYRKVWARLRVCRDIRVARKRVLRLMRENNLLSPHRCRRRGGNPHDGEIITHAPNLMWGTDGVRVFTVDDGWGWIFTAVEHWNAECVGWHVCKRGDRFAALQPISMGLAGLYGSTAAGAARGLALRMDHGSQYLSDHFTNQIKFWGIQPSYAFVAEPQTNGVAERFNRTLKEQIIHGRIYRNIAELRDAVRDFVELYNAPVDRRKERLPEPRSSSSGVARHDLNQARRVRQTCVQGTGCATEGVREMVLGDGEGGEAERLRVGRLRHHLPVHVLHGVGDIGPIARQVEPEIHYSLTIRPRIDMILRRSALHTTRHGDIRASLCYIRNCHVVNANSRPTDHRSYDRHSA